jgi:Polyketide cyclase / dehydrase and lipid transport
VQFELVKRIATQPAAAFAVLADIVEWPQIVAAIRSIEILTPGPIRPGSRLRERRVLFGHEATQELEVETIDRPHRLRLLAEHPHLHYELDYQIDAIFGGGCRFTLVFRSRPDTAPRHTLQPLMTPIMEMTLRDELEQDLNDLAAAFDRVD